MGANSACAVDRCRAKCGKSTLTALRWGDVRRTRCDLSRVAWAEAALTREELRDCRMTGASLAGSSIEGPLRRVHFQLADLTGTRFVDCDLRGADLGRAKLKEVDIRTSEIGGLRVGAGDVRGMIVSREQAVMPASLLGLVVRDGDAEGREEPGVCVRVSRGPWLTTPTCPVPL